MSHLALYRKYRSQDFGSLLGQNHVTATLRQSILQGKFSHAFLFTGPRGTGKTSTARILAKALNCENPKDAEPCNECATCVAITAGNCFDVHEFDAASEAGVEEVRDKIVAAVEYKPSFCKYKIFIIDEVHDLSPKAFDALLKTIEEPPDHVIFILATTEYNKVPPTIRSRCQKYEFRRASLADLLQATTFACEQEGIDFEREALMVIARVADGGYRDALNLLEQVIILSDGKVQLSTVYDHLAMLSLETIDDVLLAMAEDKPAELLKKLNDIFIQGRDAKVLIESLVYRVGELTHQIYGLDGGADAALDASTHATAAKIGTNRLATLRARLADAQSTIKDVTLPRQWIEAELLEITRLFTVEPAKPVASVVREPVAKAVVEKQPVQPKQPTPPVAPPVSDNPLDQIWHKVVLQITELTKNGGAKLTKSKIQSATETEVTVLFERQMDLDWVLEKPNFLPTLKEKWHALSGNKSQDLVLVANGKKKPESVASDAVVNVTLDGERLVQVAKEVFDGC